MFYEQFRQLVRDAHFPVLEWGDPKFEYTTAIVQALRQVDYRERWRQAHTQGWFHLKLEDQSLFVFSTFGGQASYSFIDRPIDVPSIRDFIAQRGARYSIATRGQFEDEYSQALSSSGFRPHVTPMRYDYDLPAYRGGVHPVAHIHIGLDNAVRIAVKREMTPTAFLLFVMRQLYPSCWERLLERRQTLRLQRRVRDDLVELVDPHFCDIDEDCLYLT